MDRKKKMQKLKIYSEMTRRTCVTRIESRQSFTSKVVINSLKSYENEFEKETKATENSLNFTWKVCDNSW